MKILVVGDVHWSQYSSILRKRGEHYSLRLENLIKSINWAERLADDTKCSSIVYLGDFFDRAELNSEEISALKSIRWSRLHHDFLVGNHEAGRASLEFNSADLFNMKNFNVVSMGEVVYYNMDKVKLCFIPYIAEDSREPLEAYLGVDDNSFEKTIVFSHNDIKGFAMGNFISQAGFDIEDIDKHCDLYLNGHLHNGGRVTSKIINVGNLTGQNFSEDAFKYDHSVIVLDTDTLSCAVYENPYALNFYKLDFSENDTIDYINEISSRMKKNCVATIKCNENDLEYLRNRFDPKFRDKSDLIPYNCNMVETRFVLQLNKSNTIENKVEVSQVDHLKQFSDYMIELLGNSDILQYELSEVCK